MNNTARPEEPICRLVKPEEADAAYALWQSLVGTPYCAWDAGYPAKSDAFSDTAGGLMRGLFQGGRLIATATFTHHAEHDGLAPWLGQKPCDLMRIGVRREFQGCGLATLLLKRLLSAASEQGFDSMRILVARDNLPAIRLYEKAGAVLRGETFSYEIRWQCREIVFGKSGPAE